MAIYALNDHDIEALRPTSFRDHGVREREDLQRLLQDRIQVVDPDVSDAGTRASVESSSWRSTATLGSPSSSSS